MLRISRHRTSRSTIDSRPHQTWWTCQSKFHLIQIFYSSNLRINLHRWYQSLICSLVPITCSWIRANFRWLDSSHQVRWIMQICMATILGCPDPIQFNHLLLLGMIQFREWQICLICRRASNWPTTDQATWTITKQLSMTYWTCRCPSSFMASIITWTIKTEY